MKNWTGLFCVSLLLMASAHGHDYGLWGEQQIDWHTDQIDRVIATRISSINDVGGMVRLDGKSCLEGSGFSFDVDESYAFDLDETVELEVEFYLGAAESTVEIKYERNGEAETNKVASIPAYKSGSRSYKHSFELDRARFANRNLFNTDFSIGVKVEREDYVNPEALRDRKLAICDVALNRSHATPTPLSYGQLALEVLDETGRAVPARVGIYDETRRLPFPSDDAIAVKRLNEMMRVVAFNPDLIPWPASNPSGFYIDGQYHAELPVGQYELVIAKGPEYRIVKQRFVVESGTERAVKIRLQRWDDLPSKGWYSGDNHIHYVRNDEGDDPNLLIFTQAEDLHVANILQMGNIAGVPWPQYGWKPVIESEDNTYTFVPGQEDPRTQRAGHTISLNLKEPIRDPQHYLIYRPVFEEAHAQGAVTGYAHVMGPRTSAPKGAALDIPYKLVDFFEVMQFGVAGTERWFDFLNLGYKLAPSAGTDYMWDFTLPGAERSYVHVDEPFTLQAWFDGLKRGETFVTNGPMLEFTVNGNPMGSVLQLKAGDNITIQASASINPDIDYLDSMELIEQGEVIQTVKAESANETTLTLRYETTAQHGSWFVVRANGKQPRDPQRAQRFGEGPAKLALSGAIYVYVDGKSFWKPSEVPKIVGQLKKDMEQLMAPETGNDNAQTWETREPTLRLWDSQKSLLKQRIDQVMPLYDDLVKRAEAEVARREPNN
jgi:hypothetical protein